MAAIFLTVFCTNKASAQDWPQWLGPNRDASTVDFVAPKTWPEKLTEKWKVTIGDGVATPSLVGNKLFVFSREGGGEVVRCLDAETGKELWQDRYDVLPADGPARGFSGPRSSPAVVDGKVVTLGLRDTLSCYDAETGKLLWRKNEYPGSLPRFFISASPIIANGLCVAQLGGGNKGGIVAYDLATGEAKWRWEGGGAAYASPTLLTSGGSQYVIGETDEKIVALGLADGKLAWETPFKVEGRGYNAATPIVVGQTVFYAGSNRGATAVKLEKDGDDLKATELWKNTDNSVQFNTPIVKDGLLYGLSANNVFFCINTKDGKTAWTAPLKAAEAANAETQGGGQRRRGGGGGGYGSIVDAGSLLLALTPSSELIAFKPGSTAYEELARIKVAESPTYAYPVVSGNRIFIKDQNDVTLYTVD
jgi:outer membrane protein assembly factor BamB